MAVHTINIIPVSAIDLQFLTTSSTTTTVTKTNFWGQTTGTPTSSTSTSTSTSTVSESNQTVILGSTGENMTGNSWESQTTPRTSSSSTSTSSGYGFNKVTTTTTTSVTSTNEIKVSFNTTATTQISLSDSDGVMQDDASGSAATTATTATTVGGNTISAGTKVEDEFEVTLTDGENDYTLVAISSTVGGKQTIIGYTFEGAWPPSGVTLTYKDGSAKDSQSMTICFCRGARIATPAGPRPIETLTVGDRVLTRNGGIEAIRWIGHSHVPASKLARHPQLAPILVAAGALGDGLPERDLRVSPHHRLWVRSPIVARLTGGADGALVAAKHLVGAPGITIDRAATEVDYFHILCARHEIVYAEGAPAETLLPGPVALATLSKEAQDEIALLFPELFRKGAAAPAPGATILKAKAARKLVARSARNAKRLLAA